jgi:glucokinase
VNAPVNPGSPGSGPSRPSDDSSQPAPRPPALPRDPTAQRGTRRNAPATERVVVLDARSGRRLDPSEPAEPAPVTPPRPSRPGYLAIDVGLTRLAAGVVDQHGEVLVRDRVATPSRNVWPALTQLVGRVLAANPGEVAPVVCGVTCPGPIDRGTGAMKPVGMPLWHDFPIRRELAAVTGLDVEVDTAGRALALAELWRGDAASRPAAEQCFATMVLGDDVDGGFVIGGRLASGLTGNLGQFGHIVVEPDGMPCVCGAAGCLTMYAGARGLEASTNRELRRTPAAIVERTGIMVARACASVAAMLDVTEIVLGGAVPSVLGEPFFEALDRELDQRSGLRHLQAMKVRGVSAGRIGPLVAAAAVARHRRLAESPPPDADAPGASPGASPGPVSAARPVGADRRNVDAASVDPASVEPPTTAR